MIDLVLNALAQFSPYQIALAALVTFVATIFHAASGVGGGLVIARLWVFRHHIDFKAFGAVMVTALPGIVVGALVYNELPTRAIWGLLGVFLVISVPLRRILEKRNFRTGHKGLAVAGAPFGLIAGAVVSPGILLLPFMLGAGLAGMVYIGTNTIIAVAVNLTKVLVFGSVSFFDANLAVIGVLIGLCAAPANYIGKWVVERMSIQVHAMVLEGIVLVGGVLFLWNAL
jgi:uncharacterized membrane protein YfcA